MLTVLIREAPILLYLQQLHRRSPQAIPYTCLGLQRCIGVPISCHSPETRWRLLVVTLSW